MTSPIYSPEHGWFGDVTQKEIDSVKAVLNCDIIQEYYGKSPKFWVWSGIHGVIIKIDNTQVFGESVFPKMHRIDMDDLKKLSEIPNFRWVEIERECVSIGIK